MAPLAYSSGLADEPCPATATPNMLGQLPVEGRPAEAAPLRPSPRAGDRRSRRAPHRGLGRLLCHVRADAERCCPCHSPTLRPWITDHLLRTSGAVDVLRGGALEPEPHAPFGKSPGKSTSVCQWFFPAVALRVFLSQAGPQFNLVLLQAGHHLLVPTLTDRPQNDKGDPVGSPSSGLLCG